MKYFILLLLLAACAVAPVKKEEPKIEVFGLNAGTPYEMAVFRVMDEFAICYTAQTITSVAVSCLPLPPPPVYGPRY